VLLVRSWDGIVVREHGGIGTELDILSYKTLSEMKFFAVPQLKQLVTSCGGLGSGPGQFM
jgi:hypothetical protein